MFVKVVELKGFSAAGHHLGLTKSSISKHIAQLERLLGAKLLNRTTRALSLTEAGREFYERAAQTVELAQEARATVSRLAQTPRGALRVTTSVTFGKICVAPLIPEFLARFPDIQIQLAMLDRVADLADEGYDLAIRLARTLPDGVVARKLLPIDYVICAAPAYLRKHSLPRVPSDLARLNCLYYGQNNFSDKWIFDGAKGRETVRVTTNLVVNQGEVIRDALLAGMGVGLLPTFIVERELRSKRLVALLPKWQPLSPLSAAYAVWLPNRHVPPKMRVFIDYLIEKWSRGKSI